MKLSLLPSPNVFFFALAGSLSIHYLYFHILLFLSLWLVLSFFSFFCSCFFFFWNTYSHTFLALWILFYELKSLRNVYFAILRCAHFATPYLNSLLLQIFFLFWITLTLRFSKTHNLFLLQCYYTPLNLENRLYQRYNNTKINRKAKTGLDIRVKPLRLCVDTAGLYITVTTQCLQAVHESYWEVYAASGLTALQRASKLTLEDCTKEALPEVLPESNNDKEDQDIASE